MVGSYHGPQGPKADGAAAEDFAAALALHRRVGVVDGHCDALTEVLDKGQRLAGASPIGHVDAPRLEAGGVGLQTLAIWNEAGLQGGAALERTMRKLGCWEQERRAGKLRLVKSRADLDQEGLAFLLSLEDASALCGSPLVLEGLYALGIRMIGLTWNNRNELADGLYVAERPGGLTRLGEQLVAHMETLGVVVDLAHIAEPGFWDVMRVATKPVVVSHAASRSLYDHPRNLTDEQCRAIAQTGGLVGICFVGTFLRDHEAQAATVADVADHVEWLVSVMGPQHVALGSDFDGTNNLPLGLEDCSRLPALTAALMARGFSEADLALFLGENWRRVFRAVWTE